MLSRTLIISQFSIHDVHYSLNYQAYNKIRTNDLKPREVKQVMENLL